MEELERAGEFACPELPFAPAEAIALLESLVESGPPQRTGLIGSSLGGYFATWLAERYGVRAVLANPAVRPYELLQDAVGRQTNLYTGRHYELTGEHLAQLLALDVPHVTVERYLLLVRTGDEVLDYREAVAKYRGCEQVVEEGGDHGFGDFDRHLERALAFCGVVAR